VDPETIPLIDIHLPEEAGVWPLAPGWWILLFALIVLLTWLIINLRKKARQRKYREMIFSKLNSLEKNLKNKPSNKAISDINILLRQLAITYYPREEIASLTGADWLSFLDKSGATNNFSRGAGRILVDAPYQSEKTTNLNLAEFTPLIKSWVKRIVKQSDKIVKSGGGVS